MTTAQLASAAGADTAWLFNAERLLGRTFTRTVRGARTLALVRVLHHDLGLGLDQAAGLASSLEELGAGGIRYHAAVGSCAGVVLDMARFESMFHLNLAAARRSGARARGRPPRPSVEPIKAAMRHGLDVGLIRSHLERSPAERLTMLEEQARFVLAVRGQR